MTMNRAGRDRSGSVGSFVKLMLTENGLKRTDFTVSEGQVYIKTGWDKIDRVQFVNILARTFPQYCFVWDSPRMLMWF